MLICWKLSGRAFATASSCPSSGRMMAVSRAPSSGLSPRCSVSRLGSALVSAMRPEVMRRVICSGRSGTSGSFHRPLTSAPRRSLRWVR